MREEIIEVGSLQFFIYYFHLSKVTQSAKTRKLLPWVGGGMKNIYLFIFTTRARYIWYEGVGLE